MGTVRCWHHTARDQRLCPPTVAAMSAAAMRSVAAGPRRSAAVCKGKSRNRTVPGRKQQAGPAGPTMPDFSSTEGPVFLIMVKSSRLPMWYPVTFMNGGSQAEVMTKGMETEWSKGIAGGALVREIGNLIYGDEEKVKEATLAQYPNLRKAPELSWGFKLVDKANPASSFTSNNVTMIPPKGSPELEAPVEKVSNAIKNPIQAFNAFSKSDTAKKLSKNVETLFPKE